MFIIHVVSECVIYVHCAIRNAHSHTYGREEGKKNKNIRDKPKDGHFEKKNNKNVPSNANTRWFIFDSSPFKCLNSFPFLSLVGWLAVTMFHSIENWSPSNGYNSIIFLIVKKNINEQFSLLLTFEHFGTKWFPKPSKKYKTRKVYPCRVWDTLENKTRPNSRKKNKNIRIKLIEIEIKFVEKFEINSHISWNWRHF